MDTDTLTFEEVRPTTTWSEVKMKSGRPANLNRRVKHARRNAEKLNRLPVWCDKMKVREIYYFCPAHYTVDHIIPLQGKLASGLHVPSNLQYMKAGINWRKSNAFVPYREVNGEIVEYYEQT